MIVFDLESGQDKDHQMKVIVSYRSKTHAEFLAVPIFHTHIMQPGQVLLRSAVILGWVSQPLVSTSAW